jgi:hypothetical protein
MGRSVGVTRSSLSSKLMGIVALKFLNTHTAATKYNSVLEIDEIICKHLTLQTELAANLPCLVHAADDDVDSRLL